jgi:hypothetical protein
MKGSTGRFQYSLFCSCFRRPVEVGQLCRVCYARTYRSQRFFGGHREAILGRDEQRCRACGSRDHVIVHHRRPGVQDPEWLIVLCAGCHARVHRSFALRLWFPDMLVELWRELHPEAPVQLQLPVATTRGYP